MRHFDSKSVAWKMSYKGITNLGGIGTVENIWGCNACRSFSFRAQLSFKKLDEEKER